MLLQGFRPRVTRALVEPQRPHRPCGRMENRLNEFFFVPKSIKIHLDDLLRTVCEAVVVQRELVSRAAENLEVACRCR